MEAVQLRLQLVGPWNATVNESRTSRRPIAGDRQLRLERDRNFKQVELHANRQQRLTKLRSSARTASNLSDKEIDASRFSSVFEILSNATESLADGPALSDDYQELKVKADRIGRIVDFYRHAETIQEHHVSGKDTRLMATTRKSGE